jgi:murein DD-endopeptidase MepM/ murein hydrolase activator NlpD
MPRTTRRLFSVLAAIGAAVAALVIFALPASAELRTFRVRLATGQIVTVSVDAPPGIPMNQVPGLPGVPIQELTPPPPPSLPALPPGTTTSPQQQPPPPPQQQPSGGGQQTSTGSSGGGGGSSNPTSKPGTPHTRTGQPQQHSGSTQPGTPNPRLPGKPSTKKSPASTTTTNLAPPVLPGGAKPNFFDTLPGPVTTESVPSFVISNFRMPIFLLPIYQAAGIQYGVRWEVLAGINEIESDYGRDLSVSSAGALGWMQFMPATWKTYGVDANGDGKADPYNPADAIFAAARYLKAAGGQSNLRQAIFAYNHASWYVDSVMLRAQLVATYPADFIASLTGMTEGRFPVVGPAKYGQGNLSQGLTQSAKLSKSATQVDNAEPARRSIDIDARNGSPVIAVNDGIVKKVGASAKLGRYVVLQDVYGNQYTYSSLGSVAHVYPVPKEDVLPSKAALRAALAESNKPDPRPTAPATAGVQAAASGAIGAAPASSKVPLTLKSSAAPKSSPAPAPVQPPTYKARLFAHPSRPASKSNGGAAQILAQQFGSDAAPGDFASYSGVYAFNSSNAVLRQLRPGSTVVAGTILGRVGRAQATQAPHLRFEVQPAGKGAPKIDPKPVLDGWRLLSATNVYKPNGKNVLYKSGDAMSIGQVLLLSKAQLQQRVLSDPRIGLYPCERTDIAGGQVDRRVLATLEYLAESGLWPTVSSLKCGHSEFTTSGNVSEHATGDAVDISAINNIPINGHQQAGGVADQTVRRLMLLQGDMRPHQIISLLSLGGNTLAMPDHADHIHIGFAPLFGANAKLGQVTASILKPGQWDALASRLDSLANPVVPTAPSKYALPVSGNTGG